MTAWPTCSDLTPRGHQMRGGRRAESSRAQSWGLGPTLGSEVLTGPLKDRNSLRTTSSEKGGCRATRLMKRFSALLRASMNSLSAEDRTRGHRGRWASHPKSQPQEQEHRAPLHTQSDEPAGPRRPRRTTETGPPWTTHTEVRSWDPAVRNGSGHMP